MDKMEGESAFPYPTGVTKDGHYGQWPEPIKLGKMGVYYWEELKSAEAIKDRKARVDGQASDSGVPAADYNFTMLLVDLDDNTIAKHSTLTTAHGDGLAITRWRYGYYAKEDADVDFQTQNFRYVKWDTSSGDPRYYGAQVFNLTEMNNGGEDCTAASDALMKQMPGYTFHTWQCFHEVATTSNEWASRGACEGLYVHDICQAPNGRRFHLSVNGTEGSFVVNPHFADAMSVALFRVNNTDQEIGAGMNVLPGESQLLLNTLSDTLSDKLRYCAVTERAGSGTTTYTNSIGEVKADSATHRVTVDGQELLPTGAYGPEGRHQVTDASVTEPSYTVGIKPVFTVNLKVKDTQTGLSKEASMTVRCLNPVKKEETAP